MALWEGIDLLDQALEEATWKDLDKVTALIRKQLDVKKGSAAVADGNSISNSKSSSSSVADYWAGEIVKLLDDLKSVSVDAIASMDAGDRDAWKVCEEGPEHRAMLRKGPEGTAINTLCMEGRIDSPVHAAVAMTRDAGFFKEWWPQGDMPVYRIVENKYLARVGDGFDITYMKFKVPWPFPWQEFAMIFFTMYDAETGVATTVVRTLPEDNSEIDPSLHGFSRDMSPPVPSGMVRMAINGGFAIKDLGPSRCHFRSMFTVDLKLPALLVNFVTKEFGGVLFNLFRKEVETDLADEEGQKGVAFRKVLKEEKLYGRIRDAMDAYRAKGTGLGGGKGEREGEREGVSEGEKEGEEEEVKSVLVATASFVEGAGGEGYRPATAAGSAAGPAAVSTAGSAAGSSAGLASVVRCNDEEDVFEDAEDQLLTVPDDVLIIPDDSDSVQPLSATPTTTSTHHHPHDYPHPPPPAFAPYSSKDPAIAAAFAAAAALAGSASAGGMQSVSGAASAAADPGALNPDVLQAMAVLEHALESLRARTNAALSATQAPGTGARTTYPGQYLPQYPAPAYGAGPGYGPGVMGGPYYAPPPFPHPLHPHQFAPAPVPVIGRMDGSGRKVGFRQVPGARNAGGRRKGESGGGAMIAPGVGGMGGAGGEGAGGKMSRKQQPPFHPSQQQVMRVAKSGSGKAGTGGAGVGKFQGESPATAAATAADATAPPSTLWSAATALFGLATCCTATGLRNAEAAGYLLPEELPSERWQEENEDDYSESDSEEDDDEEGYYEGYAGGMYGAPAGAYGNAGVYGNGGGYGNPGYGNGGYYGPPPSAYNGNGGRLVDERQVWRGRAMVPNNMAR